MALFRLSWLWERSALHVLSAQTAVPELAGIPMRAPAPESPVTRTTPGGERTRADALDPVTTPPEHAPVMTERGGGGIALAAQPSRPTPSTPRTPLTTSQTTSVELVVSPFSSFRAVGHFQQILAGAPHVQATRLRRLQQGVLQIRVECRGSTELIEGLREACQDSFRFRVQSQEVHRIEVVLEREEIG